MNEIMSRNVIEVINEHKVVGDILNEYQIGCTACTLGTCALKDIVEYHYLSEEDEAELWRRIADAVGADPETMRPPARERKGAKKAPGGPIKYSPPLKLLVEEHVYIKKLLALIPAIIETLDLESDGGRRLVLDAVDFIRHYADKFHHAKEEDILFKCFDGNLEIIKVMLEDHTTGRNHVKAIVDGVEKRDRAAVAGHLEGYRELLTQHIMKEDEILYPWMDRELTDKQVGELFSSFRCVEENCEEGVPAKYVDFVEGLEKRFGK